MKQLITIFCLTIISSLTHAESKEFSTHGIDTLQFKNTSGKIDITGTPTNKIQIISEKIKFEDNCELVMKQGDTNIKVAVKDNSWFSSADCEVNFKVTAPEQMALKLKAGSGTLNIQGMKSAIKFAVGSGTVKIDGEVADLKGKTGSGIIDVKGLKGNASLKAGSGSITLAYKEAISTGELNIKTGSGTSTVYFPEDMKIVTHFNAGSGQVYNELGDSKNAGFKVSVKAGSGNLNIKKL